MILVGFWAAFPQRKPKVRLRITDDRVEMTDLKDEAQAIALQDLLQISVHRPLSGKHARVTMVGKESDLKLDIVQLTHEAQDIIKLIGIRLEGQGRYLEEGRTEVLGARNGVWKVHEGDPF